MKEEAYNLHIVGHSYKKIAQQLKISKTKAFNYVKEMKLQEGDKQPLPTQETTITNIVVPASVSDVRNTTERPFIDGADANNQVPKIKQNPIQNGVPAFGTHSERAVQHTSSSDEKSHPKRNPPPVPLQKKIKEFTGDELVGKSFDCLAFTGKFKDLIGTPSRIFSAIIWGLPKGGKSNFSIRLADYLQEHFGKVVYVAAEEGESLTLQDKFREIDGSKATIIECRDKDRIRDYVLNSDSSFVFIDSINNAGIDADFLEVMKGENPGKSFISICQATKGGDFKSTLR